jgi:hypothetical protein
MFKNLPKQILLGGLTGLLIMVFGYISLDSKRDELRAMILVNADLQQQVDKGYCLKANGTRLNQAVKVLDIQLCYLDTLIKLNTTDQTGTK